ncbi:MAG: signal peptidase I [Planctomycetota bacterium]
MSFRCQGAELAHFQRHWKPRQQRGRGPSLVGAKRRPQPSLWLRPRPRWEAVGIGPKVPPLHWPTQARMGRNADAGNRVLSLDAPFDRQSEAPSGVSLDVPPGEVGAQVGGERAAAGAPAGDTALPGLIATAGGPRFTAIGRRRFAVWSVRPGRRAVVAPRHGVLRRMATDLARGAMVVFLLNMFVLQISIVRGHSMEPSLLDGDRLVVDRLAYAVADVSRFDVVVLRYPRDPATDFVKRVVGLPGERVAIDKGVVFVDGKALSEDFTHVSDEADMHELVVPDDHYFVLGDNRPISCDSREFGLVEGGLLRGKVRARFWPLGRFGTL